MQDRYRLRKGSDFRRVYASRQRRDGGLVSVYARPNGLGHARVGFAVSTKVGGAVVRNRVKRRLREILSVWLETRKGEGADLVVVARPEAAGAEFAALREDVLGLLSAVRS